MLLWEKWWIKQWFSVLQWNLLYALLNIPKSKKFFPYRKNANYLEEHDMEWHGDYVRQNRDLKLIGINKILVSQFECDLFTRHSCKEFIQ
jgi:hypothetical protein